MLLVRTGLLGSVELLVVVFLMTEEEEDEEEEVVAEGSLCFLGLK